MPPWKEVFQIAAVTMATMFLVNNLAATNPMVRRFFRGNGGLTLVGGAANDTIGSANIDSTLGSS